VACVDRDLLVPKTAEVVLSTIAMRAVTLSGAFGLDNLRIEELAEPRPGPGQVVLRMRAASLNYRDLRMVEGSYNPRQSLPLVPVSDGVGEVVAVGDWVTRVRIGDRVSPTFAQRWFAGEPTTAELRSTLGGPLPGTLSELMLVDAEGVVPVPEYLSDVEAACLPCAALTSWNALVTLGRVRPGDFVITQGTGGVSIFGVQLARLLGAHVIATTGSDDKMERLRELGAHEVINYKRDPEWGKAARALTGGRGVDLVLDVGGGTTLAQSIRAVRPAGHISVIGVLAGVASDLNLLPILMQGLRLQGVFVGHRRSFEAMNRALAESRLKPVVDRVFELDETRAALEHLKSGQHFGKVCIQI
jgi:NADPH:quinone reductase-like Zn-dependent oxidoreductase